MESISVNPIQKFNNPRSVIIESKCEFEIEHFQNYSEGQSISSAKVELFECGIEWKVKIHPYYPGYKHCTKFDLEISLRSDDLSKQKKYWYRLSGITGTGNAILEPEFRPIEGKVIDFSNQCSRMALINALSENGSLFLVLSLEIKCYRDPTFRQKNYCTKNARRHIVDQYLNLLNDSTFSDFAFIVKDRKFKVHKNILAGESETMRAMFSADLKEQVLGECIVDHIEPDIFECLLRFIYAGEISTNLDDISIDLYKAAHYYRIEKLMEVCKENIHFRLNASNAAEIYEWASLYDIEDVKADSWKIVKCDIFKIFFALKEEPLPLKEFQDIMIVKQKEKEFWSKNRKTT